MTSKNSLKNLKLPTTTFIISTGSIGVIFKYSSMHSLVYVVWYTLQAGIISTHAYLEIVNTSISMLVTKR
jgi:hypothetical protein